jgi:predicted TIM-barrel fold metal-dependent hydrolase
MRVARGTDADRRTLTESAKHLVQRNNVVCKISSVGRASDPDWTVESLRPWILGCIETFGADRCMLGTKRPVNRLFGSYLDVIAAYREIVDELSDREQDACSSEPLNASTTSTVDVSALAAFCPQRLR